MSDHEAAVRRRRARWTYDFPAALEGSFPGSNKEEQFVGAGVDPQEFDRFEGAALLAIIDRQPNTGLVLHDEEPFTWLVVASPER